MATPYRKWFLVVFLTLAAAHLFLMSTPRLYPFVDLPNHLAAATILRHHGEAANQFDDYYAVDALPSPNVFHLLFCGSRIFPSVETANRLLMGVYALLLPLSVLLLVRRLGGNEWYALFSFIFVPNYSVSWGFVGYAASIPFILLFVLLLLKHDGRPMWPTRCWAALLLVLLFTMHALAAFFALLVLLLYVLLRPHGGVAERLQDAAVALPVLALAVAWWATQPPDDSPGVLAYLRGYYSNEYLRSLRSRGMIMFLDNYHLYAGSLGYALSACLAAAVSVPVACRLVAHVRGLRSSFSGGRRNAFYAFVLGSLLCWLVLPEGIPGEWSIWMRYTVFVFLSLIIAASTLPWRRFAAAKAVGVCVVCLVHLVVWSGYLFGFQSENRSFSRALFSGSAAEGVLSGLMLDPDYRGKPVYMHFQNYYIVWERGIATTALIDYRFGSVRRKVGRQTLPDNDSHDVVDGVLSRKYDRVDRVLVRAVPGPDSPPAALGAFHLVRVAGPWSLFERLHTTPH